jgi:guanosine-3',5'-bis(diphosphate) 3'-pyrophosphohydrolase
METSILFTPEEKNELVTLYKQLIVSAGDSVDKKSIEKVKGFLIQATQSDSLRRNVFGMNPIICNMQTAIIVSEEVGMKGPTLIGIMLQNVVENGILTLEEVQKDFGDDVANIIKGLIKTGELYAKSPTVQSDNFRDLLISFAEDMRVILIMIAERVNIMRQIRDTEDEADRIKVANEAAYLYAPLAHKLGLYKLKSELEDLSLKYTDHDIFYFIKDKLNETKASRDAYIGRFIAPIEKKLKEAGLTFDIKGRTKSIHSIHHKMVMQKTSFENIYDLFAIRIILDTPLDKEKQQCWQVYSIITDMYPPNPKRLRDWLSIPKSNGYESLHITVMGPEGKWVEVQIRTRRMDDIAERGLAAHWRYKGIKGENGLDEWLASIREALENPDPDSMKVMDQFKMDLYEDEVFVFSPKGDLYKLPKGATVLDFAYHIHSKLGSSCIGAKVNGKVAPIRQKLNSGDQVEIMTSSTQTPKQDWVNIVVTSKARTKIRQTLKEIAARQHSIAKETLERKFKNRKIEYDEGVLMRLIKRLGYKTVTRFYQDIADGVLEINNCLDKYVEQLKRESEFHDDGAHSAENFEIVQPVAEDKGDRDVLVIDKNLKGIDYSLAKCCHPIYGDKIFGFVSVSGGIKIHRADCPNAQQLSERYGYRIVKARWAGKGQGSQYDILLHVIGQDDIGIVTNLTSIISKEEGVTLRSIAINSKDGLFTGNLTVSMGDTSRLEALMKKLSSVKGVKQIRRV